MISLFFLIVSAIFYAISVTCFFKFLDHDFSALDEEDEKTAMRYRVVEIIFMCLGTIALTACCTSIWYY